MCEQQFCLCVQYLCECMHACVCMNACVHVCVVFIGMCICVVFTGVCVCVCAQMHMPLCVWRPEQSVGPLKARDASIYEIHNLLLGGWDPNSGLCGYTVSRLSR